ncbi:MAG TPA: DUF2238 domain-containing protein [Steroidobacteraceae bacterium]|nr:DUF2238 domain-containing protein [Steroidobacteraceae bacterium]
MTRTVPWPRDLVWMTLMVVPALTDDDFLSTQGDVWDTQWDIFMALCGATVAVLTLSRVNDRAIAKRLAQ